MTEAILILCAVLLVICILLQIISLARTPRLDVTTIAGETQRVERSLRDEVARNRFEFTASLKGSADSTNQQLAATLKTFGEMNLNAITDLGSAQHTQLGSVIEQLARVAESNEKRLEALRISVEQKLQQIQQDNTKQLDQMRATVDEKLQGTLETRLGEAFKQVSERLEAVSRGLGEMQSLATGVGDLKKVLTNVKTRGTWGEVQLGAMLEQVLTPEQYSTNVAVKENGERVEFAVKLPGRGENLDQVVWLPIDAKFPTEDYQRLLDAQDKVDATAAEEAARQLDIRIKLCAEDIGQKYIAPPFTTDFAILFLPTEGLFAEVIRRPGLSEYVQRECRVVIAGPTTLWSILNSLQMGFRTLAIQKRSSEVWELLAAVKTEWSRYGEVLARVQKKLQEASNTIDDAAVRARVVGRKLKQVEQLPQDQAMLLLDSASPADPSDFEA